MATYVLSIIDKHDLERYGEYAAAGFASLQGFEFEVVAAESPTVLEGAFPATSVVLMKFRTEADADKWFYSDAYQGAVPIRHEAAHTPFVVKFND